jgi:hypothetical protein
MDKGSGFLVQVSRFRVQGYDNTKSLGFLNLNLI